METFKDAKKRLIANYARPFSIKAAQVFKKMHWTWGALGTVPDEEAIYKTICVLLNDARGKPDEETDKLGHHHCGTGRISIAMFKWDHLLIWGIELTLEP